MKNFFFLLIFLFSDIIYNKVKLSDVIIELSHDVGNNCITNIKIINNSDSNISYKILIYRGNFWYFRHNLELKPKEVRYYNDAFITCDNKSEISIEIIKN